MEFARTLVRQDIRLVSIHPKTLHVHSETFGALRAGSTGRRIVILSKAKDLEILRRPAVGGTPQNDNLKGGFPDAHSVITKTRNLKKENLRDEGIKNEPTPSDCRLG